METALRVLRCCRICSGEIETGTPVFGDDGKNLYLQAKIRKYLYITISPEDKLPKIICDDCCKKIEGIHKFALMAFTNQTTFHKSITNSSNTESVLEPKKIENKGLLHTYLTKGIKEDQEKCESEITEVEVRIDPMSILQCSVDEEQPGDHESSDNSNDINENTKKSNCPLCLKCFVSELALQNHMWSHALQQTKKIHFSGSNNQKNTFHSESPENSVQYNCPICGKCISTKGNLKVHLETHRPKGKYECDICGRVFKTQCNLHRHKEYHEGVQFTCQVCGRVYPTNSTLRAHSITHSNLRPHKCPQCDKTFKRNQDLKFHINQHTGARPYQCPYCPKAFASSGNCFSHRKRMHPIEVERDREQVKYD